MSSSYALDKYTAPAFPDAREELGAYLDNSTRMTSEEWQMYEDALHDSLDFENVAIQVNAECGRLAGSWEGRGLTEYIADCQVPSFPGKERDPQ